MRALVILEDWYQRLPHDELLSGMHRFKRAVDELSARFGDPQFWEFLPVGLVTIARPEDVEAIAQVPGVLGALSASPAVQMDPTLYERGLTALSAIRSQTAFQAFQWTSAVEDHQQAFPNHDWVGGMLPKGPYPSFSSDTKILLTRDRSEVRQVEPADIPVISISLSPSRVLPVRQDDPMTWALTAVSATHLVVVAAGNNGPQDSTMNPWATAAGVLAVGAVTRERVLWEQSSRGAVDGSMPGPALVCWGDSTGGTEFGTSFAAPRVAAVGVFVAALLSQVRVAFASAQGGALGAQNQALAIIDLEPDTGSEPTFVPSVSVPGLPLVGARIELIAEAVRASDWAQGVRPYWDRFIYRRPGWGPGFLKEVLDAAASRLEGYPPWQVGSGLCTMESTMQFFSSVTVRDLLSWMDQPIAPPAQLADELAFDEVGLGDLARIVMLARPLYMWNVAEGRFLLGNQMLIESGDLSTLEAVASGRVNPSVGGHMSRVARVLTSPW